MKYLPYLLFVFLMGCTTEVRQPPEPHRMASLGVIGGMSGIVLGPVVGIGVASGVVFGSMTGSVMGDRLQKQHTLVKELQAYGIQFFEVGDQITMVLPADRYFIANTPRMNPHSKASLRKVIALLNQYQTLGIKVAGYTDDRGSRVRNKALSTQRAQTIAHYLWTLGIDARLLYAVGYGASHFVATNNTMAGRAANRRIEITMEQVSE